MVSDINVISFPTLCFWGCGIMVTNITDSIPSFIHQNTKTHIANDVLHKLCPVEYTVTFVLNETSIDYNHLSHR